jgi:predicted nucleic acid-binding protein
MLVDTDVLIWYLKGNDKARTAIDKAHPFSISVVTYMEIVQGMRNKRELQSLRQAIRAWDARLIYLSEEISTKAMFYVEQHYLSHALQIADALIGATAVTHGLPILTANDKHYKAVKDIQIRKFRP